VGTPDPADEDPITDLERYFEKPGRLKEGHEWRAVVTYRCKRSHLLTYVLKMPTAYVLYSLRRGAISGLGEPGEVVGGLPELDGQNGDFGMPLGSCKCQPARTRPLGAIWSDVEHHRQVGRPQAIRV
jgi:hypothetical protein